MKKIIISIIVFACFSFADWHHNLDDVKLIAKKEHRLILLNFSGSDWCAPCNRLRTEIFESDLFKKFAEQKLVLLNADFPRMKKNQLSQKQQEINNVLADKYNAKGSFPLTLLLDADGKVLQEWDGYPKVKTTEEFIVQLQAITDAVNTSNN